MAVKFVDPPDPADLLLIGKRCDEEQPEQQDDNGPSGPKDGEQATIMGETEPPVSASAPPAAPASAPVPPVATPAPHGPHLATPASVAPVPLAAPAPVAPDPLGPPLAPPPPPVRPPPQAFAATMDEIGVLRQLPEWDYLQQLLKRDVANPRRALSYHTTTECQPQKKAGTAPSLKASGFGFEDIEHEIIKGNAYRFRLRLTSAYEIDDNIVIDYSSPLCSTSQRAQSLTCLEVLGFLLVSAPGKVLMHPSCFANAMHTIDELRNCALLAKYAYMRAPPPHTGIVLAHRVTNQTPRRPQPTVPAFGGSGLEPPPGLPAPNAFAEGSSDAEVLEVLGRLQVGKAYRPNQLPAYVFMGLQRHLPKRGLLTFLQRYPNIVSVSLKPGSQKIDTITLLISQPSKVGSVPNTPAFGGVSATGMPPPVQFGGSTGSGQPTTAAWRCVWQPPLPPGPPPAKAAGTVGKAQPTLPHGPPPTAAAAADPAPAKAAFGAIGQDGPSMPLGEVSTWSVPQVVAYLHFLELGHKVSIAIEEAIDGQTLGRCQLADLLELGFSVFQSRKMLSRLPLAEA